MLEIKNILTEMKVFDGFINKLDTAEETMSEPEECQQKLPKMKCKKTKRINYKGVMYT